MRRLDAVPVALSPAYRVLFLKCFPVYYLQDRLCRSDGPGDQFYHRALADRAAQEGPGRTADPGGGPSLAPPQGRNPNDGRADDPSLLPAGLPLVDGPSKPLCLAGSFCTGGFWFDWGCG